MWSLVVGGQTPPLTSLPTRSTQEKELTAEINGYVLTIYHK